MANVLSTERRAQVVAALVEGNSIRATVRMTGVAKNTITKLLVDLGDACSEYQDGVMQNLGCDRIEVDEIWAFCHAKAKNVPEEHQGEWGWGDVWTYVALDADTKLVPTWMVGYRDFENAKVFLRDLATRLAHRVQLTTDGLGYYKNSVPFVFGPDVDFAQIIKHYKNTGTDRTYSPAKCTGVEIKVRQGNPDRDLISTSYVERQNLTMRMGMRRFTRLTNAFSKKVENLAAAVSLHFMHYNFVRVHQTLGTTPAVAAGVADHVWTVREICELLLTPKSN